MERNEIYNLDAITFMKQMLEELGEESVNMFLCDLPYTYKGKKHRVTANIWDLPIDDHEFFDLALKLLTPTGCIALTATQPFTSYLVMEHIDYFKYDWVWEKDNGSNFVHVQYQPFRVHESVLIFSKAASTYNPAGNFMVYNPQFTYSSPYAMIRDGSHVTNLENFKGRGDTVNEDGKRYPRTVQQFNLERGLHPTQKPVALFDYLIQTYTNPKDLVVDVCCGSGTTGVAAKQCGRDYIVNELDKKYYEKAKERIESMIYLEMIEN